jgi:hypothetical protein
LGIFGQRTKKYPYSIQPEENKKSHKFHQKIAMIKNGYEITDIYSIEDVFR